MSTAMSASPIGLEPSKTTRTWDSLTYAELHALRDFLATDAFGCHVRKFAADDYDLVLWLVDAGAAYHQRVQRFPLRLTRWRRWYVNRLSPREAAKVAVHVEPVARIVDGQLWSARCARAGTPFGNVTGLSGTTR